MREFLITESNLNPKIVKMFSDIKKKIKKVDRDIILDGLSRRQILNVALRLSPCRIEDFKKLKNKKYLLKPYIFN